MRESQSTEVIERAVGLVAGQARTLKAALEHRIGSGVPSDDTRISCWPLELAAYLMNWCNVGSDGKTPLQRLYGRRDTSPKMEFGEDFVHAGQANKRGNMGTAIPSCRVCGDAELVVRSSGCHRARDGDQDTLSERQKNP